MTSSTLAAIAAAPARRALAGRVGGSQGPVVQLHLRQRLLQHDKVWLDHLEIPLGFLARLHRAASRRAQNIDAAHREPIAERERIVAEYRALLPTSTRAAFDGKLGLAAHRVPVRREPQLLHRALDDVVFWRKIRELARMLADAGFWDERRRHASTCAATRSATCSSTTGTAGASARHADRPVLLAAEIERRARIVDALETASAGPGDEQAAGGRSPSRSRSCSGASPPSRSSSGWPGSRGDTERAHGHGRLARPWSRAWPAWSCDADDLAEVQDGEILVAPITAPSWGPIFGMIKATVTDIGGMMSHAAIVCREYGLPAVTGTGSATTTITHRPDAARGRHQGHRRNPRGGSRGHRPRGAFPLTRLGTAPHTGSGHPTVGGAPPRPRPPPTHILFPLYPSPLNPTSFAPVKGPRYRT